MNSSVRILGLDFFQGSSTAAVDAIRNGGLLVAPAAPALAEMPDDAVYAAAVAAADLCLLDSGLLAWLWELRHRRKLTRISGYQFLIDFLALPDLTDPASSLWITPSPAATERTRAWLAQARALTFPPEAWYVAPQYPANAVVDEALLEIVRARRPRFVFVGIGGGTQEKLGAWLKAQLNYKPAILCTGAAIAFLTGEQIPIPDWADRARLGWLARCLHDPRRFIPRYWRARRLVSIYRRWGEQFPAQRARPD